MPFMWGKQVDLSPLVLITIATFALLTNRMPQSPYTPSFTTPILTYLSWLP